MADCLLGRRHLLWRAETDHLGTAGLSQSQSTVRAHSADTPPRVTPWGSRQRAGRSTAGSSPLARGGVVGCASAVPDRDSGLRFPPRGSVYSYRGFGVTTYVRRESRVTGCQPRPRGNLGGSRLAPLWALTSLRCNIMLFRPDSSFLPTEVTGTETGFVGSEGTSVSASDAVIGVYRRNKRDSPPDCVRGDLG
jgi:hypothetical protein